MVALWDPDLGVRGDSSSRPSSGPRRGPPLGRRPRRPVPAAGRSAAGSGDDFAGDPLPGHPAWSPHGTPSPRPLSTATQPSSTPRRSMPNGAAIRERPPAGRSPRCRWAQAIPLVTRRHADRVQLRGRAQPVRLRRAPTGPACASSPTRHATTARARAPPALRGRRTLRPRWSRRSQDRVLQRLEPLRQPEHQRVPSAVLTGWRCSS